MFRVKALWDELDDLSPLIICNCSHQTNFFKIQQDQSSMHFLMKLDKQYNQVRTHLLMLQELPNIQDVYRMLLQEECHREISTENIPSEPMAFGADRRKLYNHGVLPKPHDKHKSNFNTRRPYFDDHCKISGHSIDICFKLHEYHNKLMQNKG